MKASVGGPRHRELKQFAIKEAIKIWGDRVFVVTQECDRFSIHVEAGIGHHTINATKDIHPDLMMLLADGVNEKALDTRRYAEKVYINPTLVIVEAENSRQATLIRGTPSVRLYGYLLLKERYRRMKKEDRPIFVLVTWEGNRPVYKDVGLWDYVWFLEGKGTDEPVKEDLPLEDTPEGMP